MSKTFKNGSGVRINKPKGSQLEDLTKALSTLADVEVLVGFPEETTERGDEESGGASGITNAALAYIHDNGMPEQNIPQRQFMAPAMEEAREAITDKLGQTLRAVIRTGGDIGKVEQGMHQVGLIGKLAIQNKINEGIPPPLADSTLQARAAKGRKGAALELKLRKKGLAAASTVLAKPLVDTAQMRNAANYAIRSRKKRSQ